MNMQTKREEALIEALDDVEDEGPVRDRLAKVAKVLDKLLVATTIFSDEKVALGERVELLVGVKGTGGAVLYELGLHGDPQNAGSGATLGAWNTVSANSLEMVPRNQVRTMTSMCTQSCEAGATMPERNGVPRRTW